MHICWHGLGGVMAPSEASTETPQKVSKRHVAVARCIQRWKNCRFFGHDGSLIGYNRFIDGSHEHIMLIMTVERSEHDDMSSILVISRE